ncbi:hypothetical protein Rrhod_2369 [Rhodococcus rhodnii LMG 5362]|uniref:Uncharacterized protein n=1 Tax=Rhodococcus rhodnii LMG 5362 TaxID=1273125 RepID=R7WQM1_9NOCA|nr:hypothetical protein Rrhod_2369 [Rhodococcus rhodnii LMG 5362]
MYLPHEQSNPGTFAAYRSRIAARFNGDDLVEIYSESLPPHELALIAATKGYAFAWGMRGKYQRTGNFYFRKTTLDR